MYIIIEFYIIFSLMLLLFNLFYILTKNSRLRRLNPLKNQSRELLAREFEAYNLHEGLSTSAKKFLENKLSSTRNLLILEKEMEKRRAYQAELKEAIKPYVFQQMSRYSRKNSTEKAYYAYFLTLFEYQEGEANNQKYGKLLEFLESSSFYVFANTMDAIYRFEDPYLITAAIKKVDEREGFYHNKLLTDGLLTAECSVQILKDLLLRDFYHFQPTTQVSLLNYFRLKDLDIRDFAREIITERKVNEEVLYAAMRYFIRHPEVQVKEIFIAILEDEKSYWVEQLLAIQALTHYNDSIVRQAVKAKATSANWEVRSNAISYLYHYHLSQNELLEVLGLNDRYMTEQLYYYYENDPQYAPQIFEKLTEMDYEQKSPQELRSTEGEQE